MTPWQRRLRIGLAVFIVLFAAGLFFSLRSPAQRAPATPAPKADPGSVAEYAGGRYTRAKGTSKEIDLEYDKLITLANGTSKLLGVRARVPDSDGRDFTVTGREAEVTGEDSDVLLRGNLEFKSSDGLVLHTEEAKYGAKDGSVRAPGEVRFSKGRLSGQAVGLTYDRDQDVVWLLDKVHVVVAADETGAGEATIDSGTAAMARRDKYIRLEQGVTMVRAAGKMTADTALARLTDDEERVRALELRGNSSVAGDGGTGGLESMNARDIDLTYGEEGEVLQRALLVGGGSIVLKGAAAGAGRRLSAETIDVSFSPDGTVVTALDGRGGVRLELPMEGQTPARVITSGVLAGRGDSQAGLTSATFTDSERVEFVESPAKASPRVARAKRMDLALENGFDSIRSARFTGGSTFEEGALRSSASDAQYDVAAGSLHLVGADARTGRPPQVMDERATIEASEIDIGLEGRRISAKGSVKSDIRPEPQDAAAQPGKPKESAKLPSLLDEDQPVSGTSDSLAYESEASRLVYTGNARVWQGDTSIKGNTVTLDDERGDLSASGGVVTTMLLEQKNEKTKEVEKVRSVASSDQLVYEEARRLAVYSGNARLSGPQGEVTADKIELYLREGGSEVQRLEAYPAGPGKQGTPIEGNDPAQVSIRTPDGRRATGTRLTYHADDERYVMIGAPVRIIEECRETTGKTLTFFRSADRIIVDGNEQKRTEVKGSSGCSAPRLD